MSARRDELPNPSRYVLPLRGLSKDKCLTFSEQVAQTRLHELPRLPSSSSRILAKVYDLTCCHSMQQVDHGGCRTSLYSCSIPQLLWHVQSSPQPHLLTRTQAMICRLQLVVNCGEASDGELQSTPLRTCMQQDGMSCQPQVYLSLFHEGCMSQLLRPHVVDMRDGHAVQRLADEVNVVPLNIPDDHDLCLGLHISSCNHAWILIVCVCVTCVPALPCLQHHNLAILGHSVRLSASAWCLARMGRPPSLDLHEASAHGPTPL